MSAFVQELRKMAISRSVNIDQLESGVQDSIGAVSVSYCTVHLAGVPFTASVPTNICIMTNHYTTVTLLQTEIQRVTHILDNSAGDEANLEMKIEKKKAELERNQKRLRSLANVRPAFMDEYERLEVELSKQYEVYVEKHRNVSYLEHLLEEHNRVEQDQMEVSTLSTDR